MNVQEYIASGTLESYVLGLTTVEESAEVEQFATQHPEIQAELDALRAALEEYVLTFEQEPPTFLRSQILNTLEGLGQSPEKEAKEIPLTPPMTIGRTSRFSWWIAASWGLLVFSLLGNLLLYSRWRSIETRLALAESQNTTLAQRVDVQQTRYQAIEQQVAVLQDPTTRRIELKGTPDSPNARATVYWNAAKQQVYLASLQLPAAPAGKQYQLWAIVGGKPVDAGVFDLTNGLLQQKGMATAQAFAISLENTGGSTTAVGPKGPVMLLGGV